MTNGDVCLATVTTESFVPGTLVMLHSFLERNAWFTGDVVIIHDRLAAEHRDALAQLYDRVRFLQVDRRLLDRIDDVSTVFPDLATKRARFFSIEAFRLRGYRRLLFCDSDVLFRRPIAELFELPYSLVVSGDGPHHEGRGRRWRGRVYRDTFNSGMMVIGDQLLTDENYLGLLHLVSSDVGDDCASIADQIVLNIYFAGRQHLVSASYNYVLAHRAAIRCREPIALTDAHVLHYNVPVKPWMTDRLLRASQEDPALIRACAMWFDGYVASLERLYLKRHIDSLERA